MHVYYLTPEMRTPSVIRTLELVPGVSIIEGFHCTSDGFCSPEHAPCYELWYYLTTTLSLYVCLAILNLSPMVKSLIQHHVLVLSL